MGVSCHGRVEQNTQASASACPGSIARLQKPWRGLCDYLGGPVHDRVLVGSVAILRLNWEGFNGFKGFGSQCDGIR